MKTFTDERHLGALLMTIDHRMRAQFRTAFAEHELHRGDWRLLHSLEDSPASLEQLQERREARRTARPQARKDRHAAQAAAAAQAGASTQAANANADSATNANVNADAESPHTERAHRRSPRRHGRFGHPGLLGRPDHPSEHAEHGGHEGRHGHPGHRGHRERPSLEGRLARLEERGLIELSVAELSAAELTTAQQYQLTDTGRSTHAALATQVAALRERTAHGISESEWATTLDTLKRIADNLTPAS